MNNREIRELIFKSNLKKYEIANEIGITCYTFSHWLETDLTEERKWKIVTAIRNLTKNKVSAMEDIMNVGRPSKEVTCDLHIRISKEDREKLEFLAKMQGISISECAREVFRKGLR